MTLADATLAVIESQWPGGVPADVLLVNANDSTDRQGRRQRDRDGQEHIVVKAGFVSGVESRSGISTSNVERTVRVTVEAVDADEYGQVAGDDAFESLLDDIRQALRAGGENPPATVAPHSETWVDYRIEGDTDARAAYHDEYRTTLDVRWRGHV